MSKAAPTTGRLAFLFTDLQGSTRAWERAPDQMNAVLDAHDRILRGAIRDFGGLIFSVAGDAFGAAFAMPEDALAVAVRVQRELHGGEWPDGLFPRVRMGIHIGTAFERDANYFGPTLNRAARLMHAAHGGQVVVSGDFRGELGRLPTGVELRPLGSHTLSDIGEAIDVWQVVIEGLRASFPPLDTAGPPPARVPRYKTSFIGREAELARLSDLLTRYRLVTVTAFGGTGKTRLAFETAGAVADRFPDGVFAIELADGGPEQVEMRAAEAVLGEVPLARTERAADPVGALVDHLFKRRALLVLDNCEHVMPGARRLANVIGEACPQVAILATSREVLAVPGEVVVQLDPLPVSTRDGGVSPAAELFLERAHVAQKDVVFTAEEIDAVEGICERIEGLPLAIELAASRIRTLSPIEILGQLADAMSVLRRTGGRAPQRQRSLEGAIWWSWDLLAGEEQRLLARSSVFVGGFAAGALQRVGGDSSDDVLETLEALADKSLIAAERGRYRLAEPIRQFAAARLDELGAVQETYASHLAHFSRLARSVVPDLDTKPDPNLVSALIADHHNFIAAIERARDAGDLASAARLAVRLHTYWEETGHLSVGAQMLDSIVSTAPTDPAVFGAVAVLITYAVMGGELTRAEELAVPMRAALQGSLPEEISGRIGFNVAFIDIAAGRLAESIEAWANAGRALGPHDAALSRQSFWSAGYAAAMAGDVVRARELFDSAAAVDLPHAGWFEPMNELCLVVCGVLDGTSGVERVEACLDSLDRLGLRFRTLLATVLAALVLFHEGHAARAERAWRRGLEMARETGSVWGAWLLVEFAAWAAFEHGDRENAARLWGARDEFANARGYGRWPVLVDGAAQRRAAAREMDAELFELAVSQGATMPLYEAVEAALGMRFA